VSTDTRSAAPAVLRREVAGSRTTLTQLEWVVRRRLDGLLHGDHQGLLPGPGSEAADAHPYRPGDDPRRIDWALTARTAVTQHRSTTSERELETWLVVDGTASLDFGTARHEKRDLALAAAAAFGFLCAGHGNRIGAVCFDGTAVRVLPPRTGAEGVRAVLHHLERRPRVDAAPGGTSTTLADAVARAERLAMRRGLVVVVSDLLDPSPWDKALRRLTARHDVVVAQVTDPRESELPAVGLLMVVDPETGRRREVPTGVKVRTRYAAAAAERQDRIADAVRRSGAGHLLLSTDRDWVPDVVRFAQARRSRR
jgi:uncharacterized protein (DUF58 family)